MNSQVKSQPIRQAHGRNAKFKSEEIVQWMADTVRSAGFEKVVIGLSGGIDSALSATLAVRALGKDNVYPVLLPYKDMHTQAVVDAQKVITFLEIPQGHVTTITITQSVDTTVKTIQDSVRLPARQELTIQEDVRRGNVMARVRMIYLFDLAKKLGALVCGTENRTEHYLGYFTRFGDEASDIEPIRSLYKTQVWEMAKELGVPSEIITKAPTAGLWEGQTDEGELGFSYEDADKVLSYYFDEHFSPEEIIKKGISESVVSKVLERVKQNDFKHNIPYLF
jgi:NAD+ synthase